ncbi:MAG: hypothetical protein ACRC80_33415, partial [Waterburya sp.]
SEEFNLEATKEDLNELSSLESVEKKIDELNKVSDKSLEELNNLLRFVQENTLDEVNQNSNEITQEDKINS